MESTSLSWQVAFIASLCKCSFQLPWLMLIQQKSVDLGIWCGAYMYSKCQMVQHHLCWLDCPFSEWMIIWLIRICWNSPNGILFFFWSWWEPLRLCTGGHNNSQLHGPPSFATIILFFAFCHNNPSQVHTFNTLRVSNFAIQVFLVFLQIHLICCLWTMQPLWALGTCNLIQNSTTIISRSHESNYFNLEFMLMNYSGHTVSNSIRNHLPKHDRILSHALFSKSTALLKSSHQETKTKYSAGFPRKKN